MFKGETNLSSINDLVARRLTHEEEDLLQCSHVSNVVDYVMKSHIRY